MQARDGLIVCDDFFTKTKYDPSNLEIRHKSSNFATANAAACVS